MNNLMFSFSIETFNANSESKLVQHVPYLERYLSVSELKLKQIQWIILCIAAYSIQASRQGD